MDMDTSFQSEGSVDSPNTVDWKFRHCTGTITEREKEYVINKGLMRLDENGEYRELSTIVDSDFGDLSDEEEEVGEKEPVEVESLRDLQSDQVVDKLEHDGQKYESEIDEIDELMSFSDRSDKLPPLEAPEVEEVKSPEVSVVMNVEADISTVSMKETPEALDNNKSLCTETREEEQIIDAVVSESEMPVSIPDEPAGIISEVLPAAVVLTDDKSIEELVIPIGGPGIEDMSPANVIDEDVCNSSNTTDSFADISLDAISDASFNFDQSDEALDAKPALDESFRTCDSTVSVASFKSCKDKEENPKTPDDLDDTITLMEKLLQMADEQEAKEAEDNISISLGAEASTESVKPVFKTPLKSPRKSLMKSPRSARVTYDPNGLPSSPSIFATPKAPVTTRSKRISLTSMDTYLSPGSPQEPHAPSSPLTKKSPSRVSPKIEFSPKQSPFPNLPPRPPTGDRVVDKNSPRPKPAVQMGRLCSILDSPASASRPRPIVPVSKMTTTPRFQRTPEKKMTASGHPITSPVANYIYSLPPPTQIRRMAPPPIVPHHQMSPVLKFNPYDEPPVERATRIPKPKLSLPVRYLGTLTESGDNVRKGREYGGNIFAGSMQKEFTPTHYVGSDGIRPVAPPTTVGDPTYPPRYAQGARNAQGITPVSHRHLGKRDSKNASMVAEANVQRKFCPPESSRKPGENNAETLNAQSCQLLLSILVFFAVFMWLSFPLQYDVSIQYFEF